MKRQTSLRKDNKTEVMIGQTFGQLKVVGVSRRRRYPTTTVVLLWVACACGAEYEVEARAIRNHGVRRCWECSKIHLSNLMSLKLPSGATLSDIARRTGIKQTTLYQRWHRSWTEAELSIPTQKQGF